MRAGGGISARAATELVMRVRSRFPRLPHSPDPEPVSAVEAPENYSMSTCRCNPRAEPEPDEPRWRAMKKSRPNKIRRTGRSAAGESSYRPAARIRAMPQRTTGSEEADPHVHDKCCAVELSPARRREAQRTIIFSEPQ